MLYHLFRAKLFAKWQFLVFTMFMTLVFGSAPWVRSQRVAACGATAHKILSAISFEGLSNGANLDFADAPCDRLPELSGRMYPFDDLNRGDQVRFPSQTITIQCAIQLLHGNSTSTAEVFDTEQLSRIESEPSPRRYDSSVVVQAHGTISRDKTEGISLTNNAMSSIDVVRGDTHLTVKRTHYTILNQESVTQLPYPNSIFNKKLPNAGNGGPTAHLMANSDNIVQVALTNENTLKRSDAFPNTLMGGLTTAGINEVNTPPVYYGQATDLVYVINSCSQHPNDSHNAVGTKWHIPNNASFNHSDSDYSFTVWDQTNDMFLALYGGGSGNTDLTRGVITGCPGGGHAGTMTNPCPMAFTNMFKEGRLYYCTQGQHDSTTDPAYGVSNSAWSSAGFAPPVTLIRRAEIASGHIKHAVNIYTGCTYGTVFPNITGNGSLECGTHSLRPPNGALVFLDYTTAQLNDIKSHVSAVQYEYIEVLTLYGGYISDTGGVGNGGLTVKKVEGGQAYKSILGCSPTASCAADPVLAWLDPQVDGVTMTKQVGTTTTYRMYFWKNVPLETGFNCPRVACTIDKHFHIAHQCVAKALAGVQGGCP